MQRQLSYSFLTCCRPELRFPQQLRGLHSPYWPYWGQFIEVDHWLGANGPQRAGMTGTAFTYFTTENAKAARELINILREAKNTVPPQLEEMAMFSGGGGGRSA